MKHVLQNFRTGGLILADVPIPALRANGLLVRNAYSPVSVGTEKQLTDFARKSLLGKARARPDPSAQGDERRSERRLAQGL